MDFSFKYHKTLAKRGFKVHYAYFTFLEATFELGGEGILRGDVDLQCIFRPFESEVVTIPK